MKSHLLLLALVAAALSVKAELVTETPVIEVRPKPEDDSISTPFIFHNKGDRPVRVLRIQSSCSCLSAEMDKAVYQPGEKGVGKAVFRVSGFVGRHEKTIHVETDDPKQADWAIQFVLDVPAVVEIEPKTLQWWVGDAAAPKTCVVKMTGPDPMHITGMSATRQNVEFSWKEIVAGREYEVKVRPKSTDEVLLGALRIETDSKIAKFQRQLAFFSVYRKPEGAVPAANTPPP